MIGSWPKRGAEGQMENRLERMPSMRNTPRHEHVTRSTFVLSEHRTVFVQQEEGLELCIVAKVLYVCKQRPWPHFVTLVESLSYLYRLQNNRHDIVEPTGK